MNDRVVISSQFLGRPLSKSGEADLLGAADRLDILDLLHTVGWCIDARAHDVLNTIISEDFVYDHAFGIIEGRQEFIDFLVHEHYFVGLRHQNANPLLRSVDLSNAIAVSYLTLTRVASEGALAQGGLGTVIHGVSTDLLKKEKEIWKLAKRTIDQVSASPEFISNAATREKLAMTTKQRRSASLSV